MITPKLEAGPELDAAVAVQIMGWTHVPSARKIKGRRYGIPPDTTLVHAFPPYSTSRELSIDVQSKVLASPLSTHYTKHLAELRTLLPKGTSMLRICVAALLAWQSWAETRTP